jgi:Protein of unknown function (DUF2950)
MHDLRSKVIVGSLMIALALIIPLTSGTMSENAVAAAASQSTFASPEQAGRALVEAAKSGDENAVLAVFGPGSKDIIYSGDATQDKKTAAAFVSAYQVMNRWRKIDDSNEVLIIGADNFTFPVPLKKDASGRWYFDTAAGKDEILARRIGRNELAAIEVSQALADAQHEYFSQSHGRTPRKQYALKFVSDKGTHDGLYWDSAEGQPRSPLGPLVAYASGEGYKVQAQSSQPFHGYHFHMLKRQGKNAQGGAKDYISGGKMVRGFAFVAYPAAYGNSGIMTFIINQNGVVYQKDLGKDSDRIASKMTVFNPDKTWTQV